MRSSDWSSDVCSSDLDDARSGNQRGCVRRQKDDGAHEVLDGAEAAEFDLVENRAHEIGIIEKRLRHRRCNECRCDGVGPNAMRCQIERESLVHAFDRPFGRAVQRAVRASDMTHLRADVDQRSEEHTSELQSLMRISYAVFCLKKKNNKK